MIDPILGRGNAFDRTSPLVFSNLYDTPFLSVLGCALPPTVRDAEYFGGCHNLPQTFRCRQDIDQKPSSALFDNAERGNTKRRKRPLFTACRVSIFPRSQACIPLSLFFIPSDQHFLSTPQISTPLLSEPFGKTLFFLFALDSPVQGLGDESVIRQLKNSLLQRNQGTRTCPRRLDTTQPSTHLRPKDSGNTV